MTTSTTTTKTSKKTTKAGSKKSASKNIAKRRGNGSAKANLKDVNDAIANVGGNIIGYQVWWHFSGADGLRADMAEKFKKMNIEDCLPGELEPAQRMVHANHRLASKLGVKFERAGRKNGWSVFRPMKVTKVTDKTEADELKQLTIDPKVLSPIMVNETDGTTNSDANCQIAQAVIREYERLETHFWSRDVRNGLLNLFDSLNAILMRQNGGMYFVPAATPNAKEKLEAMENWIQSLGSSDLYIQELSAGSAGARSSTRTAMNTLDDEYQKVFASAEDFIAKLEAGELVNGRSLNSRVKLVKNIKNNAAIYSELLQERGEKLTKAAAIVGDAMKALMDASVEARALKKVDSERAQSLANDMLSGIAKETRNALKKARGHHEPVKTDSDDE